jgi:N6-adenosine-specific RNA methylase IME4
MSAGGYGDLDRALGLPPPEGPALEARHPAMLADERAALEEAGTLGEVAGLVDKAGYIREAARRAHFSRDAQNDWAEYRLDAERKAGGMLAALERFGPGRKALTLRDFGLERNQSSRWQLLAALPDGEYRAYLERARAAGEVTERGALDAARQHLAAGKAERLAERGAADLATLGTFSVILADPPWEERISRSPGRALPYPAMPLPLIKALRVPAADDAALYLWAPPHLLDEAREVLTAWGFTYKTHLVWVKPSPGMGRWTRVQHEDVLVGARGAMRPPLPGNLRPSVVHAPRGEHSVKPAEFHDLIETAHPGLPRLELFARQRRPGWEAWGNEVAEAAEEEWARLREWNAQVYGRAEAPGSDHD